MRKQLAVTAAAAVLCAGFSAAALPAHAQAGGLGGILGSVVGAILGGSSNSSGSTAAESAAAHGITAASNAIRTRCIERDPNTNERMLFVAIDDGDFATVQNMLDRGVDINAYYVHWNTTPLGRAMNNKNRDMMQFLLERGADVRGYDAGRGNYRRLRSYLVEAVDRNDLSLVQYLHNWGADVNSVECDTVGEDHSNALFYTSIYGDGPAIYRYLIAEGIDVNYRAPGSAMTPLIRVAKFWNVSPEDRHVILQILVEGGAKTHLKDSSGRTAIDYCLDNHDLSNAQYLQQF